MNKRQIIATQDAIAEALRAYPENEFSGVSDLWQSFFDNRRLGGDFASLTTMLSEDNDSTYGVAIKIPDDLRDIYRRFYEEYFAGVDVPRMPDIGQPRSLDVGGRFASVAYLQNYSRVREILPMIKGRKVHVLEIGAGYGGMAQQLIASGNVASYTIVDLPNNLELSNFYLRSVFPDYRANTCKDFSFDKALNFLLPQQVDELAGHKFDVAINCDSFGEMPAGTAQAYVRLLSTLLADEGFAYLKNGHRRTAHAVQKVSDYGYERFDLKSLRPMLYPSEIFGHHHHMVVLGKHTGRQSIDPVHLDTFAEIVRSGIHGEVRGLGERIVAGGLTVEDREFLAAVEGLYRGHVGDWRPSDTNLAAALDYLGGVELTNRSDRRGKALLKRYCEVSKSSAAEAVSLFVLSRKGRRLSFSQSFRNGVGTEFLLRTMKLDPTGFGQGALLWRLRKPMIEALTRPYAAPRKPLAVLAKNVVLNLRDGRGLKVSRLS